MPNRSGAWVKERRQAKKMTQKQLADIVWCSPNYIGMIERGQAKQYLSFRLSVRLADALSDDDDDRAVFLSLTNYSSHVQHPRLESVIQAMEDFQVEVYR